jgi:hypothetical protein
MAMGTESPTKRWTAMLWRSQPPRKRAEADFDAIKGTIAGSGLAVLFFWLPLALTVLHARG